METQTKEQNQIAVESTQTNCITNVHEQRCKAITCAIVKLRYEMREHAKLKTLIHKDELNYVYKQLENILKM